MRGLFVQSLLLAAAFQTSLCAQTGKAVTPAPKAVKKAAAATPATSLKAPSPSSQYSGSKTGSSERSMTVKSIPIRPLPQGRQSVQIVDHGDHNKDPDTIGRAGTVSAPTGAAVPAVTPVVRPRPAAAVDTKAQTQAQTVTTKSAPAAAPAAPPK